MTSSVASLLEKDLKLDEEPNSEIRNMWLQIAVYSGYHTTPFAEEDTFLGEIGRMKFLNPVFKAVNSVSNADAVRIYKNHKGFYHPIAAEGIEKMLSLTVPKEKHGGRKGCHGRKKFFH